MIEALLTLPCVVSTPVAGEVEDAMGEPIPAEPITTSTVCEVQQVLRTENRSGGPVTVVEEWRAYLPIGTPVEASSDITTARHRYTVDGAPWVVRHPRTGVDSHIEATVRVVT